MRCVLRTIIITGSTRGIGFGLAENFLKLEQQVVVSGRSQTGVDQALDRLLSNFPADRILGVPCDMRDYAQVQSLWDKAASQYGGIDIWINNAGVAHPQADFWELREDQISSLVDTNMTGAMFGARIALAGFMAQGRGAFYNMEGLGSDGRRVEGLTLYGTTKRGLNYLTNTLAEEVKGTGVIVGGLSPGMVITEFITDQYQGRDPEEWERAKRIFNILADLPENVTPYLAEQVLTNTKNGARIRWLTRGKILWRFLTASLTKRDLFQDLDI
jgi:NAD(P)-dependent dehydrogenase (short-subunit alcohol dehydrogenase family)